MKVLIAGVTGVIGRELAALLHHRGDEVFGLARSTSRAAGIPVHLETADALDRGAVSGIVRRIQPDAIVNLLTAIPKNLEPRRFGEQMTPTNRLRTVGTANLLAQAGKARLISESVGFFYRPGGRALAREDDPLWHDGPRPLRGPLAAVVECERLTLGAGGVVLRLGHVYGPGTHMALDGEFTRQVHEGKVPVAGGGHSTHSFIHVRDAAAAFAAALAAESRGVFNVVDSDPAPMNAWLPELAQLLNAPAPKKVPGFAARMFGGSWGHAYMTALVGADNRRARNRFNWAPRHASWRHGFAHEFGQAGEAVGGQRGALS